MVIKSWLIWLAQLVGREVPNHPTTVGVHYDSSITGWWFHTFFSRKDCCEQQTLPFLVKNCFVRIISYHLPSQESFLTHVMAPRNYTMHQLFVDMCSTLIAQINAE